MDTTKNSREETGRRPGQEAARKPRPREEKPQRQPAARESGRPSREQAQSRPNPERSQRVPREQAQRQEQPRRPEQEQRKTSPEQGRRPPVKEGQRKAVRPEDRPARKEDSPRSRQSAPQKEAPRQQPAQNRKQPPRQTKAAQPRKEQAKRRPAPRREEPDDLSRKKRAYGNSKPKKKSSLAVMGEAIAATAKESAARRRARQEKQGKRAKHASQPTPAVIYTQPQVFNRDRFLVQLVTVTAVVVAFVVGISVFFKVGEVRVSGAGVYTAYSVEEASGIQKGDNLLTFSRARAGALIKANLPYVKNVSFGIKLPDTVNIIIEEEDVVYAIKDQDEQWWLINSDGLVVEQAQKGQAGNYTQILGVALDHPLRDQVALAVEALPVATLPEDAAAETTEAVVIGPTVSGAQKLATALQIVRALEDNDIVGAAASINVSQTQSITLWYGTRYQVNLGDTANLEYKISCMNSVIMNMQEYQSGILDISFTIWPNQVGYTPFA